MPGRKLSSSSAYSEQALARHKRCWDQSQRCGGISWRGYFEGELTGILIKLPYGVICDELRQLMLPFVLLEQQILKGNQENVKIEEADVELHMANTKQELSKNVEPSCCKLLEPKDYRCISSQNQRYGERPQPELGNLHHLAVRKKLISEVEYNLEQ